MRVSGYQIPPLPLNFFKSSVAVLCLLLAHSLLGGSWLPEMAANAHLRIIIVLAYFFLQEKIQAIGSVLALLGSLLVAIH